MKTNQSNPLGGQHPSHSWIDVVSFDHIDDAAAQKAVLEREGFEVRLHDERRLQKYWFWTAPQGGIHLQIAPEALPDFRQRLKTNPALVSSSAIRCPSCGSTRVQYPQMTRKFLLPTLFAEAMVFLRFMRREYYCEDCHDTWARPAPQRKADRQSGLGTARP